MRTISCPLNDQNIILVGPMGVGKTTIGKAMAKASGREFIDLDHEIEHRTGVSIPTIFDIEGEAGFRRRESDIIAEITAGDNQVIATGGGAVVDDANRAFIKAGGFVVYLTASVEKLVERTRSNRNRPLLNTDDPVAVLSELKQKREHLYRDAADLVFQVDDRAPGIISKRILKQIEQRR